MSGQAEMSYKPGVPGWCPPKPAAYAYVLGMYLGDGCISYVPKKHSFIQISLDSAYPGIVDETKAALETLVEGIKVGVYRHKVDNKFTIQATYRYWPDVIPQHGPGRKHERPIVLRDWQRGWLDKAPEQFLRGLIHSDGCRTVNRFTTELPSGRVAEYEYPRYFFSNLSADIRGLFCEYCDKLGIRTTRSNHRNISVSHRHSVAKLDEFVGPKR